MAQPYVGEIRMFGGTFAPAGWGFCKGQLIPIAEYETLFNLIGTTYGGDGQETFALPDLQGRIAVHQGKGPGITQDYTIGEVGGVEEVTLTREQMPTHSHGMLASQGPGNSNTPQGNVIGSPPAVTLFKREAPDRNLAPTMVLPVGNSQPHENKMPYLTITYIISFFGIYPSPT
ncbi:MAG TPA: tail fiber protein [Solirubrobacterales bacterium]|nr:tail fiber protein [Solirubrobacterales bacterium]